MKSVIKQVFLFFLFFVLQVEHGMSIPIRYCVNGSTVTAYKYAPNIAPWQSNWCQPNMKPSNYTSYPPFTSYQEQNIRLACDSVDGQDEWGWVADSSTAYVNIVGNGCSSGPSFFLAVVSFVVHQCHCESGMCAPNEYNTNGNAYTGECLPCPPGTTSEGGIVTECNPVSCECPCGCDDNGCMGYQSGNEWICY